MIFPQFNSICIWSLLIASFLLSVNNLASNWVSTSCRPHWVTSGQSNSDIKLYHKYVHISKFLLICKPFLNQKSIKSTLTSPCTHTNSTYWQWLTVIWGPPLWSALGQTQQEQCWCWELGHCLPLVDCSVKPAANTDMHPHMSQADLYKHVWYSTTLILLTYNQERKPNWVHFLGNTSTAVVALL